MALIKSVSLNSGITTSYHRIVSVNNITNSKSIIEVASYLSKEKRLCEKEALQNNKSMNIFIHTEYVIKDYTPELNVNTAYAYLKTLEKFISSTDDIE